MSAGLNEKTFSIAETICSSLTFAVPNVSTEIEVGLPWEQLNKIEELKKAIGQ
jgi:hypothetical protein